MFNGGEAVDETTANTMYFYNKKIKILLFKQNQLQMATMLHLLV